MVDEFARLDLPRLRGLLRDGLQRTVAFYREYTGTLGDRSNILDLVRAIGTCEGVGELLGQGTRRASKALGVDYAMQVKGLELAAYDPRKFTGMAISYSTANRGGDHSRAWTVGDELSSRDFSAEELARMVAEFRGPRSSNSFV